jgi:hypothetical protein
MQKVIISSFTKGVLDSIRENFSIKIQDEINWISENKAEVLSNELMTFENVFGRVYFSNSKNEIPIVIAFAKNKNEFELAIRGFICGR